MLLEPIDDARTAAFTRAFAWDSPVRIATSRVLAFNDLGIALERSDDVERVEVLTDDETVSELRDHFLSGTHLREYTQSETLEIRSESTPVPTLALSDSEAIAITGLPGAEQISLDADDETFLERTNQAFSEWFEAASSVTLRTPPYSELVSELEARFNGTVRADFDAAIQAAREPARPSLSLHPATITILVGAFNEMEFYEIGRWGEETRLASKATFSRMKKELEENDVIEVESVQRDVGRPRHRLLLDDELAELETMGAVIEEAARCL